MARKLRNISYEPKDFDEDGNLLPRDPDWFLYGVDDERLPECDTCREESDYPYCFDRCPYKNEE